MSESPLHSVSVAGITFDEDGRVLLIRRRDSGKWQAPGGVLELDETFEDGVAREVLEETGVQVEAVRLTGVYKNLTLGVVALVYRCRFVTGEPRTTRESVETAWIDYHEALAMMPESFSIRIMDATDQTSAASRSHDGISLL